MIQKNKSWVLVLALVMALGALLPGQALAGGGDRPLYLSLSMEADGSGNYTAFVLQWQNPEAIQARLDAGEEVAYEVDIRRSDGLWLSAQGLDLVSGSLSEMGPEGLVLKQADLKDLGDIDVFSYSYRFKVRYLIDGQANSFSNEIRVGARTTYENSSNWFQEELKKANQNGFITPAIQADMKADISREEFTEVAVRVYERAKGVHMLAGKSTYKDTDNPSVQIATDLGLVQGVGYGHFLPEDPITREELAVIVSRLVDKLEIESDSNHNELFSDHDQISEWALDRVYKVQNYGVIQGDDKKNFNPKANTSREEAVVIGQRVYDMEDK